MTGEAGIIIAGGVESMSRSPYVIEKSAEPFSRSVNMFDTTLGWRFVNREMERMYGTESMMQTAENIATEFKITRDDQDRLALISQEKALTAQEENLFNREIIPVAVPQKKGEDIIVEYDEHPRKISLDKLASLKPLIGREGTITAGNASGINDGASALIIASSESVERFNLNPLARISGMAVAGVPPRIMGIGPVPATIKLLKRLSLNLENIDIIELNEAFAAQALGCIREMGLRDEDERINRWGGAIALGHPLGMSGARLVTTALHQLAHYNLHRALCTMCIGVGQGIAVVIERA
jgi:acetyl-CoA acyltransferase